MATDGRAFQSEGNGPVSWGELQTELLERMPGKNATVEVTIKNKIETVRLCAFTLPGSLSIDHSSVVFPLTAKVIER